MAISFDDSSLHQAGGVVRGKRFVECIAGERLQVVAREASRTILRVSNGAYGLEADAEGAFYIIDNKNGGIARRPSTLSGGETFLASLALALSTQIQLNNDAPLELLFLDEGFGTLDASLGEEVISVLERLLSDLRAIGLISHVEEIKNRVPIKLIVTAAKPGVCGSRLKIVQS